MFIEKLAVISKFDLVFIYPINSQIISIFVHVSETAFTDERFFQLTSSHSKITSTFKLERLYNK